jgi:hypothetical protein
VEQFPEIARADDAPHEALASDGALIVTPPVCKSWWRSLLHSMFKQETCESCGGTMALDPDCPQCVEDMMWVSSAP